MKTKKMILVWLSFSIVFFSLNIKKIEAVNQLPIVSSPSEGQIFTVRQGEPFSVHIHANDPEGQKLIYALRSGPSNFVFSVILEQTRMFNWLPSQNYIGHRVEVVFYVSDDPLGSLKNISRKVRRTFFIDVLPPISISLPSVVDQLPSISFPSEGQVFTVRQGEPFSLQIQSNDFEGQNMVYISHARPSALQIDQVTGLITWIPCEIFINQRTKVSFAVSDRFLGWIENRETHRTFFIDVLPLTNVSIDYSPVWTPPSLPSSFPQTILVPTESLLSVSNRPSIPNSNVVNSTSRRTLRIPSITSPLNLFLHTSDWVTFEGLGTPGSQVIIAQNDQIIRTGQVSSNGQWSIHRVPVKVGENRYTIWAVHNGLESKRLDYPYTRASWWDQNIFRFLDTAAYRVFTGETRDLRETTARMGLDMMVIGDAMDIGQQSVLFITRDERSSLLITGLSFVGIATTLSPTKETAITTTKVTVRKIENFTNISPVVGASFKQGFNRIVRDVSRWRNPERLVRDLQAINERLFRLLNNDANLRVVYERIVRNHNAKQFATYLDRHGEHGLRLIERAGRWVEERVTEFPRVGEHFRDHRIDTGVPWFGRSFRNVNEYLRAARGIISNPRSRRVLYYHGENLNHPRLGYLLERNGNVFLTAVNEHGNIVTFHHLENLKGGIRRNLLQAEKTIGGRVTFDKLFEIDLINP